MKRFIIPIIGIIMVLGGFLLKTAEHKETYSKLTQQKNYCIEQYKKLEKEFQSAKGYFHNDKKKIVEVKVEAIKLLNNCSRFDVVRNQIKNLIKRCNEELGNSRWTYKAIALSALKIYIWDASQYLDTKLPIFWLYYNLQLYSSPTLRNANVVLLFLEAIGYYY